ncbi:MAG: nucleotidyltransferase family protein [Kordiimonadaceae bacterium]|nr:nucleotidyltransferase family protein [Kordiimonadaceae bacterium]
MLHSSGRDIDKLCISPGVNIWKAVEALDNGGCKTVFVVDSQHKLLGLVADPDIRQALLTGQNFDAPVRTIMNRDPLTLPLGATEATAHRFIMQHKRDAMPVLNDAGKLVDVMTLVASIDPPKFENEIILMAGGVGSRLLPLTQSRPKPLVEVGSKPMLEILIENLAAQGFGNITLALNYMGDMIQDFFGNGEKWGVNIRYLRENKPLGTAGGLSLLDQALLTKNLNQPFVTMNCDVLTKVDFKSLIDQHTASKCLSTVCVSRQEIQVPYGVVEHEDLVLQDIVEKPVWNYFVNAGVYVFEPDVLHLLQKDQALDMPDFIQRIKKKLGKVSVFPIHEYWLDIGTHTNLEQAQKEYHRYFGNS